MKCGPTKIMFKLLLNFNFTRFFYADWGLTNNKTADLPQSFSGDLIPD